jgi:RNA polymerase sigma factor (sigma-70 family)
MFYAAPLLSKEQEHHLFRQMNFLKFQARRLQGDLTRTAEAEALLLRAEAVRNRLVAANLRLIVPVAKRQLTWSTDPETLFSDGAFALVRAADKFDYLRGTRFSTYGTQAIMNAFASARRPRPFREVSGYDLQNSLEGKGDRGGALRIGDWGKPRSWCSPEDDGDDLIGRQARELEELLSRLDPRTGKVLRMRYGLDGEGGARSLDDVGAALGVSKQRVRQIERQGLACMRQHAEGLAMCC